MALEMKYFVLNPEGDSPHASASRAAMKCYAEMIRSDDPERADQLIEWAERERMALGGVEGVFADDPVKERDAIAAAKGEA